MATLPKGSLAVTVTLLAVPAVTGVGKPETVRVLAPAGFTVKVPEVPAVRGDEAAPRL